MAVPKIEENKYYTIEEYLAFEELAEEKHEYHNGYIYPLVTNMAGTKGAHSLIAQRTRYSIERELEGKNKNCSVFDSDMKVKVETFNRFVYPDASVVCGDINYFDDGENILENPVLIIEVLSKSSKKHDKGEKFEMYRAIPSFKEYMIVYQTIPKVQTWYKMEENIWKIGNATGLDQSITLHSLGCTVALKDIYKRIKNLQEIPEDLSTVW